MYIGLPLKLLYEGIGHTLTIELKTGDTIRGHLANVEDNMNILIASASYVARDGKTSTLEQVFIRGSQIRMAIFPDMLRHAPMFKLAQGKNKGRGLGIGQQRRAMVMRARAGGNAFLSGSRPAGRGRGAPM
eukprot:Blabericola_migrator_1__739@NODE_1184_length_5189_cov_182_323702_g63_i1_p6_GENE_NODE_1184_length_5189_cov_182_323702_g63_i1NODE_1184_length_5189_cov_182_323702_g63_i1_p6_ORF_typecomplete_len131_score21_92LSM/PF01423_22/9_1e14SMATX/PF14438_6/0_0065_NODE_1184_length_5189_cov_182_323702_g63_i147305122